jgi:hypothetical protein
VPKPIRTRPASADQVRAYAGKAQEYADASVADVDAERYVAATSLAVHARINAADAVCGACGPDGPCGAGRIRRR